MSLRHGRAHRTRIYSHMNSLQSYQTPHTGMELAKIVPCHSSMQALSSALSIECDLKDFCQHCGIMEKSGLGVSNTCALVTKPTFDLQVRPFIVVKPLVLALFYERGV